MKKKKPKGCLYISVVFFAIALLFGIIGSMGYNSSEQTVIEENIIIDVSQFSRISTEQLIEIMGEPDLKKNGTTRVAMVISIRQLHMHTRMEITNF